MKSWKDIWARREFASDNEYPTEHFQAFFRHHVLQLLEEQVRSDMDYRPACLDFGCGSGANSIYAASCGLDTIAVDLSKYALQLALSRLEGASRSKGGSWGAAAFYSIEDIVDAAVTPIPNRRLILEGEGTKKCTNILTLEDIDFLDIVIADGVLYYLCESEVRDFISFCSNKLKPGGLLRIYTKNIDDGTERKPLESVRDTFIVTAGYEKGLTWFLPEESFWLEILQDFSEVKLGYDSFSYTGEEKNSFLVITATL
jgi:SAM-dependent methyltransferase